MFFMSECKRKKLILFWDSGDTIVEEVTEVRNERGIVTSAKLHEGCTELLLRLYQEGFRMALVADGEVESFENIYRQHELESVFEVRAVSEALPERKPAAIMFSEYYFYLNAFIVEKDDVCAGQGKNCNDRESSDAGYRRSQSLWNYFDIF